MKSYLQNIIEGQVYTDPIRTGMLSTDGSIFSVRPSAVVYPASVEDVIQTVRFARDNGISIHPRGAGSGLCGAALGGGIVIDFSKYMNRLLHIDIENQWMECEPGYRGGELEVALNGSGLFFPPDPSSAEYATFGGMYGTNASGAHSVKYGNVSDYILDAQVVLTNGLLVTLSECFDTPYENLPECLRNIYDLYIRNQTKIETAYPDIRCNTTGYNLRGMVKNHHLDLTHLFAGAEGTLGVVTRLKFRLIPRPPHDALVIAFFPDIIVAAQAVQQILPLKPSGIEIMDRSLLNMAKIQEPKLANHIPDGIDNVLLIEFDAQDPITCADTAANIRRILTTGNYTHTFDIAVTPQEKENFWAIRKAAVPILYRLKGEKKILALIEDAAIPTDRLPAYFHGIYEILNRHHVSFVVYGHIAKGLLHTRPLLNLKDTNDVRLLKPICDDVFDMIQALGGAISGEHGDGRLRSAYIQRQYPTIYPLFQEVRAILDPPNLMNPDILVSDNSRLMQENLRYGAGYRPVDFLAKRLLWPEGFMGAIEICHGCSRCTTVTTATRMCPVYKVTRDEAAAPKAKANILRMLLAGAIDRQDLYLVEFQKILSLCIQCGSCQHECPSGVNIPKMVIEARSAYRMRYGVSFHEKIVVQAEAAGKMWRPIFRRGATLAEIPWIKTCGALLTGVSSRHKLPLPVDVPLYNRVPLTMGGGGPRILFFTGCYAASFRPSIGHALLSVLTSMNMTVLTPVQCCCGLPMMSKAMIPEAIHKIEQNYRLWGNLLDTVDHIVVSCSSCGRMLLNEWQYLRDTVFTRKVQEKLIHVSRLIHHYSQRLHTSPCERHFFYHMPCHLKVQPEPDSSLRMLSHLEKIVMEHPATHCCGMAGTWGLSADHTEMSLRIGSDLRQKLRHTSADAGVTDCPTCALQMSGFCDIPIRHPVEIIAEHLNG